MLLAFCGAQVLAQIPITPGGLGFVEAGLTGMLTLAGVAPGNAVLATFAYRLFSYWLPLPVGLAAYGWHARRLRANGRGDASARCGRGRRAPRGAASRSAGAPHVGQPQLDALALQLVRELGERVERLPTSRSVACDEVEHDDARPRSRGGAAARARGP